MPKRNLPGRFFLLLVLALSFLLTTGMTSTVKTETYSRFSQDVAAGKVARVTITGLTLIAYYWDHPFEGVRVTLPAKNTYIQGLMIEHRVQIEYSQADSAGVNTLLFLLLPSVMVVALILAVSKRGNDGGTDQALSVEQSRAKLYIPGSKTVRMSDVAGMPEVKEELAEVINFLRSPDRYRELGARVPKGVLLWGPPGTGKTLLARAVAGEAGVPFFSLSGSDFVELFAGVGAARVRDLFAKARQSAPCILFVDEIDAVGRQRGVSMGGGSDEREQTLNQLLVEMDGFAANEGVIVIAATNRLDVLDAAILRPGRFDRQIAVDPPDRQDRLAILAVHAQGKPLADDVEMEQVAGMCIGFTGADLANLLNEAAILAVRRRQKSIGMNEMNAAFERIITGGPSVRRTISPAERQRIAIHEAGHVIVASQLEHAEAPFKVTILPQGSSMGHVLYKPGAEKQLKSRSEIMDRMVALVAGRAAEEVVLGEASTGAADDLYRATQLARRMVTEFGMSPEIGPIKVGPTSTGALPTSTDRAYSEQTAVLVDHAVRRLLTESFVRAKETVKSNRTAVEKVVAALLDRESLSGQEVEQLLHSAAMSRSVTNESVRQ